MKTLLFLLFSFFTFMSIAQDYRYVSDVIYVTLRTGQGNQYTILHRGLKSGTKLLLLEDDEKAGWSRVQLEDGTEGWVRRQYLNAEPVAAVKLIETTMQLAALEESNQTLNQNNSQLKESNSALQRQLEQQTQLSQNLSAQLLEIKQVSGSAIETNERLRELLEKRQLMQTKLDILTAENQSLLEDKSNTFFLYGAGAVLCGIFISMILPLFRRRSGFSEWRN